MTTRRQVQGFLRDVEKIGRLRKLMQMISPDDPPVLQEVSPGVFATVPRRRNPADVARKFRELRHAAAELERQPSRVDQAFEALEGVLAEADREFRRP